MDKIILEKLKKLEETSWDFRNIAPEEGTILNTIIKAANYKNVLEAGTSNGYSSIWLAEAVRQTGGHVTTMEIEPEKVALAEQNFKEVELTKFVSIIKGDVFESMQQLSDQFDLIFIDGGRDYLEIFKLVDSKLLKPNGILAVDNVISHKDECKEFLDTINADNNYQKVTLAFGGGLLIALKLK